MRKAIAVLGIVALVSFGLNQVAHGQNPGRSAKNFNHFLTVWGSNFNPAWKGIVPDTGTLGPVGAGTSFIDYYMVDTALGLNCARREDLDLPGWGVNPSIVKSGPEVSNLKYMWYNGQDELNMLGNSEAVRFEAERHKINLDSTKQYQEPETYDTTQYNQYNGFLEHNGSNGRYTLVGTNAHDNAASSPVYARHSPFYGSDTTINCLQLHDTGHPGYFADSMWNNTVWSTGGPWNNWSKVGIGGSVIYDWVQAGIESVVRKAGLRFRVRLDGSYTAADTIFTVRVNLQHYTVNYDPVHHYDTINYDTVYTHEFAILGSDSGIIHSPGGYDTVTVRFMLPAQVDSTFISLYWTGGVPITMDWMEALTTQIDSGDNPSNGGIYLGLRSPDSEHYNERVNYEQCSGNNFAPMKECIDTLISRYRGYYQFVEGHEEPPLGQLTSIKRAIKLLRDRSGGDMELFCSIHDSTEQNYRAGGNNTPFYGLGLPNQFSYYLEGVRLGWLDSSLYADPKFFWTGFDIGDWTTPAPLRAVLPSDSIYKWEARYANTSISGANYICKLYDRDRYLTTTQDELNFQDMRRDKRVCDRNASIDQRFFIDFEIDDGYGPGPNGMVDGGYRRTPTAAQVRLCCNAPTSCGASGLYIWDYNNAGIVTATGDHSSNWTWVKFASGDSALWWDGHGEHYSTLRSVLPTVRLYGDTLLDAKYLGDWTAVEADSLATAPFVGGSVVSLNDSGIADRFSLLPDSSRSYYGPQYVDTSLSVHYGYDTESVTRNRTFVHVSEWLDTNGEQNDTLLYITNLRTDDSYVIDSTTNPGQKDTVPGTFDRRYITMQMKAPHLVTDVADTANLRTMGKVRTPYVGVGDSLVVWLLPGDGVLVRLTPAPDSMKQMRVALNYPRIDTATHNKYDHGNIRFSEYVYGVSPHPASAGQDSLLIPSSLYSYVGIKDTAAPTLHQDSLLYKKFSVDRPQMWRHQNWSELTSPVNTYFGFKRQLASLSIRPPQIGSDSIAHAVTITTELEDETMDVGHVRVYDPFYVHDTTYLNQTDTSDKPVPFRPDQSVTGPHYGADPQHYGGVFLHQNDSLRVGFPNYALSAYPVIKSSNDSGIYGTADWTDYTFLQWHVHDRADSIFPAMNPSVVFYKDSAEYIARYKVHNLTYISANGDTGYSFNNQRKLVFLGRDSADNCWYANTFASYGRIYLAIGSHPANNYWITWKPERLITDWNDTTCCFPAVGVHLDTAAHDTSYDIVYQNTNGIQRATLYHDSVHIEQVDDETYQPQTQATPVIAAIDLHSPTGRLIPSSYDVIAYGIVGYNDPANGLVDSGIAYRIMSKWEPGGTVKGPEKYIAPESAMFPTIWARDSTDEIAVDSTYDYLKHQFDYTYEDFTPVYLAWQEKDSCAYPCNRPMAMTDSVWDVYVQPMVFSWNGASGLPVASIAPDPNTANPRVNVSKSTDPSSWNNWRPCISGIRLGADSIVLGLAWESNMNDAVDLFGQGVAVALHRTGTGWWRSFYYPSYNDTTNFQTKPSITMTRYTDHGAGWTTTSYFYSLVFETTSEHNVMNIALDDSTQRVTAQVYLNLRNPQCAVMVNGYDSNAYRVAISTDAGNRRWLEHQNAGLFKISIDHTKLYDYRAVTERDSASGTYISQALGEMTTQTGTTTTFADMVDRNDTLTIDSLHPPSYFMGTEPITLPSYGTLAYTTWILPASDSLFAYAHETLAYRLDCYDTAGRFLFALDSFFICDTMTHILPQVRSVLLTLPADTRGVLRLDQISGAIPDSGTVRDIISLKVPASFKQSSTNSSGSYVATVLPVTVHPNPAHNTVKICVADLPAHIPAMVEVVNEMGVRVAKLYDATPDAELGLCLQLDCSQLPSGTYFADFQTEGTHTAVQFSVQH